MATTNRIIADAVSAKGKQAGAVAVPTGAAAAIVTIDRQHLPKKRSLSFSFSRSVDGTEWITESVTVDGIGNDETEKRAASAAEIRIVLAGATILRWELDALESIRSSVDVTFLDRLEAVDIVAAHDARLAAAKAIVK